MFLECTNFDEILHGNFSKLFQVVVIAVFTVLLTFPSANILFCVKFQATLCSKLKLKKKKKYLKLGICLKILASFIYHLKNKGPLLMLPFSLIMKHSEKMNYSIDKNMGDVSTWYP